jgi:hypothetical protein
MELLGTRQRKQRDDPACDYKSELAALLALWSEELDRRGEPRY